MPDTIRSLNLKIAKRVLTYHRGALLVGTFGEECLCGWRGESWTDHVAPLLVDTLVWASEIEPPGVPTQVRQHPRGD